MVMKRNAMRRNLRQSILNSFGRYIAIAAIIALGAGLFVGLLMTKTDMVATGQQFVDRQNMFDLRMVSNYGWSAEFVEKFAQLEGVESAEGLVYLDLIANQGDGQKDSVYRFYAMPERLNQVSLLGGRMPEGPQECLADGYHADDSVLGQTVTISSTNDKDSLKSVRYRNFTVVGYVSTPLYMDMNRGTTSVGSGSLANYYYLPEEAFDVDYYTEIHLTLPLEQGIYTEEYSDALEKARDAMEPMAEKLSEERFLEVKAEAEEEYQDGYQEYLDGLKEFEEGKAEAEQELADAEQKLTDAEQELKDNRKKLIDAGKEIEDGEAALDDARAQLEQAWEQFKAGKAEAQPQIDAAKQALDSQYATLKPSYDAAVADIAAAQAEVDQAAAEVSLEQVQGEIGILQAQKAAKESEKSAAQAALEAESSAEEPDTEKIGALNQTIQSLDGEISALSGSIAEQQAKLGPYNTVLATLNGKKSAYQPILDGVAAIESGYADLKTQQAALDSAEAELKAANEEIEKNAAALHAAYNKLMISWGLWHDGEEELAEGWEEYREAKLEAEQEIADAEAELREAEQELADAREEIDGMDEPDLIILDRSSNVGYNNLDSSSDIVAGVSRVLPVFFLLVASLVCITTMTRMIEEERTQIGTLKALGYSNGAIISKYMIYSGSGALLGCSLGILLGCTIFPQIIWEAYSIMLCIQPDVVLKVDWPLAIAVVTVYTAVMLFVTWYSCHRTLEEEPAELIRPKAPDAGKKILLERLPFWQKIGFLNKVTIRNIFRYRQRLAMMLVGIGGCTALLLTGFGLRDSLVNLVNYQFEDVTHYDLSVYFREEPDAQEQAEFLDVTRSAAQSVMFYHQSSVEVSFDDRVKEVYMISGDSGLSTFIDLHSGDTPLELPGKNQAVLSVGVAENLGIRVGDRVILRNADLEELDVTVSAIYDNHVYNYVIVMPETIQAQWGRAPEKQMAFVQVKQGQDVHALGAAVTDLDTVMNVSVSDDLADMVSSMMQALDLVVIVIVICAGLLAVIVLYNLTNININERIREIATIKVLGFNAGETAAYVFKENMALTVAGSVLGLGLGYLLLVFVMSQIRIDMVWFKALIAPRSYVWSVALTLLSAIVVNFIFYFKLEKINMAEALKSVE